LVTGRGGGGTDVRFVAEWTVLCKKCEREAALNGRERDAVGKNKDGLFGSRGGRIEGTVRSFEGDGQDRVLRGDLSLGLVQR